MPIDFTQANRRLRITTPLGDDQLLITSLTGAEGMSTLFGFEAELVSQAESIEFDDLVWRVLETSFQSRPATEAPR